jgi:hypothetical protein
MADGEHGGRPPGPPPWRGIPPERGTPPAQGRPKGSGLLPGQGIPREQGRLLDGGSVPKGTPGQTDRGAPGQLDPWAENPWAPGEGQDEAWAPAPKVDLYDEEDLYLQHPNFYGNKSDPGDDEPGA